MVSQGKTNTNKQQIMIIGGNSDSNIKLVIFCNENTWMVVIRLLVCCEE